MGLTSGLLQRSIENPLRPLTDAGLITLLGGAPTHSGMSVNEKSAVRFIAVYRAVSLVSAVIAALPFVGKRGKEPISVGLLNKPHFDLTPMELWERVMWAELLTGNSFCAKLRDGKNAITYLDPYDLGTVTPRRVKRTAVNPWGKEFDLRTNDWPIVLTPWDVLHIPGPGYDGAGGLSPIGVARQGIGVGLAAEEFGARHFGSGSLIAGVLQTDQPLDQPQAEATKRRWQEKTAGLAHAHEAVVLDRGLKWTQIGIPPKDAQFLETRKFAVTDVARLYGIPPHLLGDVETSTSWGTGIEQQQIGLIVFTLTQWMTRVEQRVSVECLAPSITADFDTSGLLRGDVKTRMEAAGTAIQNGIKNRNEARAAEGLAPVKGGDRFLVPSNHSILGDDGLPVRLGDGSTQPQARAEAQPIVETVQPTAVTLSEFRCQACGKLLVKMAGAGTVADCSRCKAERVQGEPVATPPDPHKGIEDRLDSLPERLAAAMPRQEPQSVTIAEGAIRMEPPQITVNVPGQAPPRVVVNLPAQKTITRQVARDKEGRITSVTETPDGT